MNRTRAGVALLVIVVVVALGAGASALERIDDEQPSEAGGDEQGSVGPDVDEPIWGAPSVPSWLLTGVVLAGCLLAAAFALLSDNRRDLLLSVGILLLLGFLLLTVAGIVDLPYSASQEEPPAQRGDRPEEPTPGGPNEGGDGTGSADPSISPYGTLLFFVAVFLFGGLLFHRVLRSAEPDAESTSTTGSREAAVGRAAGRAAEQFESATPSNAVYEAWHEMTAALQVPDPETTTPREFEAAAVEAGLDRGDVETLTALFQAVRYGGAAVTPERAQQAEEALRRIEATYAEEPSAAGRTQPSTDEGLGGGKPS